MNGIFDISSEDDFFFSIERSFKRYQADKEKSIELLLYILLGLNHLRDWIAPNYYDPRNNPPANDEQRFYQSIHLNDAFNTIRSLCNRSKHLSRAENTSSSHDLLIDDWSDIDSVINFDKGPSTGHFVGTINISEIIKEMIVFYKKEWFDKKKI